MSTFYYTFEPVAADYSSERELQKYCHKLVSFADLDSRFSLLKSAFENKQKERADIILIPFPELQGVAEISVFHNIKFKLFSKAVKSQSFCMSVLFPDDNDELFMFERETQDFDEVRAIFKDVVEQGVPPDVLNGWQRVL